MKYLILIALLISSCKQKSNNIDFSKNEAQNINLLYELILEELKNVDTNEFHITYEVKDSFDISDDIKFALQENNIITEDEKNRISNRIINSELSTQLSSKTKNIIQLSQNQSQKKTELNYILSKPFQINGNKILILNSVQYRDPLSGDVKGGTKRAITFIKDNEEWRISKIINLIDM